MTQFMAQDGRAQVPSRAVPLALAEGVSLSSARRSAVFAISARWPAVLPTPFVTASSVENSALQPIRLIAQTDRYVVRTQLGEIDSVPVAAQRALLAQNNARLIRFVRTFA